MKRCWLGLGLLILLLIAGLLVTMLMGTVHEAVEDQLQQAAGYALEENWQEARRHFDLAKLEWDRWAHVRASFADHGPIEEIDGGFALLEVYCQARENSAFAAECLRLARQTAAVGEAHGLVWWNIL